MKNKIFLLVISLIVLLPLSVKASEEFNITGCSAVKPGKTVKCTVTVNSSSNNIDGFKGTVKVKNNLLSVENIEIESNVWNGTPLVNGNMFQASTTKTDGVGKEAIAGYVILKAGETEGTDNITLDETEVTILQEDGNTTGSNDVKVNGVDITISNSAPDSGDNSENGNVSNTDTVNPQTTDVNIVIIILALVVCSAAVVIGKKRLNKISK